MLIPNDGCLPKMAEIGSVVSPKWPATGFVFEILRKNGVNSKGKYQKHLSNFDETLHAATSHQMYKMYKVTRRSINGKLSSRSGHPDRLRVNFITKWKGLSSNKRGRKNRRRALSRGSFYAKSHALSESEIGFAKLCPQKLEKLNFCDFYRHFDDF